jgi:AcrR family transcriptional regulator
MQVHLESPATEAIGRRERKRLVSYERLYEAAIELFLAQGFDSTTVDQIAERADMARATAFNHFPQKVAYLEEWGRRRREEVRRRLSLRAGDAPAAAALHAYLHEMAAVNAASRPETMALIEPSIRAGQALRNPTLDVDLAELVRHGQATGEFRADADADQVGLVLGAAYFSTVLRWAAADPAPFGLAARLEHTLDLVLRGLR